MKAYRVSDRECYAPYVMIVYAESRGKAISYALGTDGFSDYDFDFTMLRATRAKWADKYFHGNLEMDWDNPNDRLAMVKEGGFVCDEDYADIDECKKCEAKEWCEEYERLKDTQTAWDEYDHCYECRGLGDDYRIADDGELESCCDTCPCNPNKGDD